MRKIHKASAFNFHRLLLVTIPEPVIYRRKGTINKQDNYRLGGKVCRTGSYLITSEGLSDTLKP